jgi:plastocyanin
MRTLSVSLIVLALGLGAAVLVISPGASAHSLITTFTGRVGTPTSHNAYSIALSTPSTVAPGTYQFNITDYATIHNFDLCKGTSCTGSNSLHKTSVPGTGTVSWTVTLAPGTYTYVCDAHPTTMKGHFLVGTTVTIASVTATRTLVTVGVTANRVATLSAALLKGTTKLATATAPSAATSATLKLKPTSALSPGTYTVQAKATVGGTSVVTNKQIQVS